jgi:hypothetical protein
MYTSPGRVERDGWLVAYEGEEMSMDEAARRGLITEGEPEPDKPAPRRKRKAGK